MERRLDMDKEVTDKNSVEELNQEEHESNMSSDPIPCPSRCNRPGCNAECVHSRGHNGEHRDIIGHRW